MLFRSSEPRFALGEGDDGFIVFGIGLDGDVVESEDGIFDGDGALQLPAAIGDGLDEGGFEIAGGVEVLLCVAAMFVVGDLVFGGEDVDLAGEAMAIGVEGARIARFGFGLCRFGMHR